MGFGFEAEGEDGAAEVFVFFSAVFAFRGGRLVFFDRSGSGGDRNPTHDDGTVMNGAPGWVNSRNGSGGRGGAGDFGVLRLVAMLLAQDDGVLSCAVGFVEDGVFDEVERERGIGLRLGGWVCVGLEAQERYGGAEGGDDRGVWGRWRRVGCRSAFLFPQDLGPKVLLLMALSPDFGGCPDGLNGKARRRSPGCLPISYLLLKNSRLTITHLLSILRDGCS